MDTSERVDLASMNLPGGPISSRRKPDRVGRGWKKIELWIEQEEAEEIVIDGDEPTTSTPKQEDKTVRVKVEDEVEPMQWIQDLEPMLIEEDAEDVEERLRNAERRRRRRRKEKFESMTEEEKLEMVGEELDQEVLKRTFGGNEAMEDEAVVRVTS